MWEVAGYCWPQCPNAETSSAQYLGTALLLDVLREDDLVDCINYIIDILATSEL